MTTRASNPPRRFAILSRVGPLRGTTALAVLMPLLLMVQPVQAQDTEAQGAGVQDTEAQNTGAEPFALETIVLEARGRAERLEDVPFNASVLEEGRIDAERIRDNSDLSERAANVNYLSNGVRGFNRFSIRGVGDIAGGFAPDDNSVGFFIEGIPVPLVAIDSDLLDVEQVEVLRGPQNGLFGRNAQAGAINLQLREPSDTPDYSLGFEVGNQGYGQITATASGALSDQASGRVALRFSTLDGDVPNDLGADLRGTEALGFVGSLNVQLGEATDVRAFLTYEQEDEEVLLRAYREDPDYPRVSLDIDPLQEVEATTFGLRVTHDFGGVVLESATGLHDNSYFFENDLGGGRLFSALSGFPPEIFDDPTSDFAVQTSDEFRINQEFRLKGSFAGGEWQIGANAFDSDYRLDADFNLTGLYTGTFISDIETRSYDLFAALDLALSDRWRAQAELRHTWEKETFAGGFVSTVSPAPVAENLQEGRLDSDFFTGRLSALYAINDRTSAYVTYARGAKAGGFSTLDTDLGFSPGAVVDTFDTAKTDTFEIGVRGSGPGNRLRYALAAFYNDTTDEQISAFDFASFTTRIENADTRSRGVELELAADLAEGLTLTGALGWLDTEITSADPATGARIGGDVPYAPNLTLGIGLDYTWSTALFGQSGVATLGGFFQYVDERKADIGNTVTLDSYQTVDLRAAFRGDNGVEVFGFIDNAFDENYETFAFPFGTTPGGDPVTVGLPGTPRRYGVGVRYTF